MLWGDNVKAPPSEPSYQGSGSFWLSWKSVCEFFGLSRGVAKTNDGGEPKPLQSVFALTRPVVYMGYREPPNPPGKLRWLRSSVVMREMRNGRGLTSR